MFHGLLSALFFSMWFEGDIFLIGRNTTVCGISFEIAALIAFVVDTDVLSAALDAGTAVGLILIYFWLVFFSFFSSPGVYMLIFQTSLQYPMNGNIGLNTIQKWWGNQVFKDTLDWKITPLRKLDEGAS